MGQSKTSATAGADWTKLLTDPELVGHLGKLLQIYRDASPEKRDQALLEVMREIKGAQTKNGSSNAPSPAPIAAVGATPSIETPPFEPDLFTPTPCWGQDRRRFPRLKCFVAVELKIGAGSAQSGAIYPIQALEDVWSKPPLPCPPALTWRLAFGSPTASSG